MSQQHELNYEAPDPLKPRMTKAQFLVARRSLERQISWALVIWTVLWVGFFVTVGVMFRGWFGRHDTVNQLLVLFIIFLFIVPPIFISRRLREHYGLLCRTCGHTGFVSKTGQCLRCKSFICEED